MSRFHKRSFFDGMPRMRIVGFLALMGFVLFVAFRIFTPPTEVVQTLSAPDGIRAARLMHVFYYSDPGYKISTRRSGGLWRTIFYLPEYKGDVAEKREATLRWSPDSQHLYFDMNGQVIWSYDF